VFAQPGILWNKLAAARKTDDHAHRACCRYLRSPINYGGNGRVDGQSKQTLSQRSFAEILFSSETAGLGCGRPRSLSWSTLSLYVEPRDAFDSSLAGPFPLYTSSPSCAFISTSKIQPTNSKPSGVPSREPIHPAHRHRPDSPRFRISRIRLSKNLFTLKIANVKALGKAGDRGINKGAEL